MKMHVTQYMWSGRMPTNKDLVSTLQKHGRITSQKVADAMEQIDRGIFVPPREPPYMDTPVPIGYNATISAPHMHAICLELLKDHLQPGMHALDVGAGVGHFHSCRANHGSGINLASMIYHMSFHYFL
jgi:protein-L-isoaspartate(D-aspartate) O-methyltransferase